jgi:hypothetical protein
MIVDAAVVLWGVIAAIWFLVSLTRMLVYHEARTIWLHRLLPSVALGLGVWLAAYLGVWIAVTFRGFGLVDEMLFVLLLPPLIAYGVHWLTMRRDWES